MYSQPKAQDVSKRPARQSWQGGGDLRLPPGRAPLLFALAQATLCPASSSLRHLWQTPWFSGWPDFLSLLLVFCSCLCLFSCPAERNVSLVRLCRNTPPAFSPVAAITIWVLSPGLKGQRKGVRGSRSTVVGLLREENPGNRKCRYSWCVLPCRERESIRGSMSGCFHILRRKNKLIYFLNLGL